MQARPELALLRAVVEKELLHHDILREMAAGGFLAGLTFIGGTCLLPLALIPTKIRDQGHTTTELRSQLQTRLFSLAADPVVRREFIEEMRRFLPAATVAETVAQETYWQYLTDLVRDEGGRAMKAAV